jgi:hypothetical protein
MKDERLLSQKIPTSPREPSVSSSVSVDQDYTMNQENQQQNHYSLCELLMKSICSTPIMGGGG